VQEEKLRVPANRGDGSFDILTRAVIFTLSRYLALREPGIIHHHAEEDVHDALLLGVRESDVGEGQRQDVEELAGVELDQCPEVRVERLVDGTRCRV